MRYQGAFFALATVAAFSLAGAVQAQIVVEDFEGPLPGPQGYPGGYTFHGGALEPDILPGFVTQITDTEAASGVQSFQINIDGANQAGTWGWYGGIGGFVGFYGPDFGFAQGQPGANNPANYRFSFDLKVQGNDGADAATPVGGAVGLHDPDYEVVNNIDLNDDGFIGQDPSEGGASGGYDIWNSTFMATVTDNEWTHIVWDLDTGTEPTSNFPEDTVSPYFDDETTIFFQIYFNSGGFGIDDGNVIYIDNVALEFIPPTATPGDFNGDGEVDGRDFLVWQRGESPNALSAGDLAEWQENYNGVGVAMVTAIPEPGALVLVCAAAIFAGCRRRINL